MLIGIGTQNAHSTNVFSNVIWYFMLFCRRHHFINYLFETKILFKPIFKRQLAPSYNLEEPYGNMRALYGVGKRHLSMAEDADAQWQVSCCRHTYYIDSKYYKIEKLVISGSDLAVKAGVQDPKPIKLTLGKN